MNKEEIDELMEYNLEYLEARNSEDIFGGDYTSQVDLKYANKELEQLQQENKQLKQMIDEQDGCNIRRLQIFDLKDRLCKELKNVKLLKQENKKLKSIIKTLIKIFDLEPSEYVENLLKGEDKNENI